MGFQKYFQENKIPEWKKLYINIKQLESILIPFATVLKHKPKLYFDVNFKVKQCNEEVRKEILKLELTQNCREILNQLLILFCSTFISQMQKVNEFFLLYSEKLQLNTEKLEKNFSELRKTDSSANYQILKETCSNLYMEAKFLSGYCLLNRQAIKYLLDQFTDQTFYLEVELVLKYWHEISNKYSTLEIFTVTLILLIFLDEALIQMIMNKIEKQFIYMYYPKEKQKGIQFLKYYGKRKYFNKIYSWYYGIYFASVIFIVFNLIMNYFQYVEEDDLNYYNLYFPMFRCQGLFLMYYWFLALNAYGWQKSYINYRQLFSFNQHYSLPQQIFMRCSLFSTLFLVMYLICMQKIQYLNYKDDAVKQDFQKKQIEFMTDPLMELIFFDPALGPFILWIFFLFYLFLPTKKSFNGQGRKYFIILLLQTLISPFYIMEFRHIFVCGQFFSFVRPFKDLDYTICFYYKYFSSIDDPLPYLEACYNPKNINIGLIAAIFPIVLKWMQLGRSAYNKRKFFWTDQMYYCIRYFFTFLTAIFSYLSSFQDSFLYVWIFSAFFSTIVSFYFDVKKDWGFLVPNKHYKFLRQNLAYDHPYIYYAVIIIDLPLRFSWTLSISPNLSQVLGIWPQFWIMIIASIELFRRFLWNFIRVEREHLVNEGEFKTIPNLKFPFNKIINSGLSDSNLDEQSYIEKLKKFKNYIGTRTSEIPSEMKKLKEEIKQLSVKLEQEMKSPTQFQDIIQAKVNKNGSLDFNETLLDKTQKQENNFLVI